MSKPEKKKSLHVLLEQHQIQTLDKYQKEKGLENRSQAIRHVLNDIQFKKDKKNS